MIYSTDASIYQIVPKAVAFPKTDDDLQIIMEYSLQNNIPITPRGGGTSLAGATVGDGIIIDFSMFMNKVLDYNPEENWVEVQPGIILDELNRYMAPENKIFGPDPSTSNRGNIGGAIGNNSCGAHSLLYGKTIDNVIELNAYTAGGNNLKLGPRGASYFDQQLEGLEGNILNTLNSIRKNYIPEIISKYPSIQRRVSGYNLDELVNIDNFNTAQFVVGSEGTLVTFSKAKVKVHDKPKFVGLALIHFDDLISSMEATVSILEHNPSAIEHIGSMILRQAKNNLEYSRMMTFVEGDPESVLAVEMIADSQNELQDKLEKLKIQMDKQKYGYSTKLLLSNSDQQKVWNIRKAGLGLMMSAPGDYKAIPFVEDTAVDPKVLPEFVREFDQIVRDHDTEAGYYGHASVGCLHIRPLINLKDKSEVAKMKSISKEITDLVIKFGGSISGEHGDGLVRSYWNKKMFGEKIYKAFKELKYSFDPNKLMNPGKIVDAQEIDENLRINPEYKTKKIKTGFNFDKELGFASAIEMCNGQAACRKVTSGVMCPSYMVTRDEELSTRGRANALRGLMSGQLSENSWKDKELFKILDLCLECKACKSECPSNVDMAKLKYEYMYQFYKRNKLPIAQKIIGNINTLSKIGCRTSAITNFISKSFIFKKILELFFGIDSRRDLPKFAKKSLVSLSKKFDFTKSNKTVLLFPDTFNNYQSPEVGLAIYQILKKSGYNVIVPQETGCCGRPMLSSGQIDKAKKSIKFNIDILYKYAKEDIDIIGVEPSCILGFKSDFLDLVDEEYIEKAKIIKSKTFIIDEFLTENKIWEKFDFKQPKYNKILIQPHCHQQSLLGNKHMEELLKQFKFNN
ncbi:MAG: oxidoreductase, partial [Chloroflexi bacterium]|nr:oxidoreductase [Chloroflexota bacterium]